MKKLREILLTQYIGAITIGLVLAQSIFGFVNAFVQAGATYIALRQARSVMARVPGFSWQNFITSMVTVFLYAVICFLLIRWLYSDPAVEAKEDSASPSEATSQP